MLAGIVHTTELAEHLVFKGGTALRKCYYTEYRYSEDLDFSTLDMHTWTTEEFTDLITKACGEAQQLAEQIEAPYTFSPRQELHRVDRTDSQQNYRVAVELPTGARLSVKVEVTQIEPVITPTENRRLIHGFPGEPLDIEIQVYGLNEIAIEKLRAFLQASANVERRGWTNRARDLYDLWWLWVQESPVNWQELIEPLRIKAEARGIAFASPDDFRDPRVLALYGDNWQPRLAAMVPLLPEFDEAVDVLDLILKEVFSSA